MSVPNTSKKRRKVWCIIGIVLLVWCVGSLIATKWIYDAIFQRCDSEPLTVPSALSTLVNERTVVEYTAEDHRLTGYVYTPSDATVDAVMVLAPGFHATADEYLWQIQSFVDKGWTVFSFDPTGCGRSEGESSVGFPQERVDLEHTLTYLESKKLFGRSRLVLVGHSRGAYAACCAADEEDTVAAVVSVSGVNSAMEGIMSSSVDAVGPMAYGNYPFLWFYQTVLFGDDTANCTAVEVLSETDVPTLIVQGQEDTVFPPDKYSVASHMDEIDSPHVQLHVCEKDGQDGHTDLLFNENGAANEELMETIHRFCLQYVK